MAAPCSRCRKDGEKSSSEANLRAKSAYCKRWGVGLRVSRQGFNTLVRETTGHPKP